jgi:hypothetical protein
MRPSGDPYYHEQADPVSADKRDRVILASTLRLRVIKLDSARVDEPMRVPGDFLFADRNSTGLITLKLNSTGEGPMPFAAMDSVHGLPINDIHVTNAAQAGLVLNLWFGYRARFTANSQTITSIGAITNQSVAAIGGVNALNVTERGAAYGASFVSNTAGGAATNQQLVAPAVNVNGIIVYAAKLQIVAGVAVCRSSILAKASAPGSSVDGEPLATVVAVANGYGADDSKQRVFVSSGKGLHHFSDTAENASLASLLYTVL